MTKQTKKQICESKATVAYYSGLGGLEAKHIEYGIDDYMYLVSGVWHGKRVYHRLKIHYGAKNCYPSLDVFICLSYLRREPLNLASFKEPDGEVIIRKENRYLSEVTDKGYTFSSDIADALVFKSTAEARNLAARSGQHFLYKARFICADNKFTIKDYRIKAILPEYPNGVYIRRFTRNTLRFCHESKYALKFASEQQARKYIAKLSSRFQRVINYAVVQAKEA